MFGIGMEKLLLVAVLAALIIGPRRLPLYARRLADAVRGFRRLIETARQAAEIETGLTADDWRVLDPRRYDPRAIVREAASGTDAPEPATVAPPAPQSAPAPDAGRPPASRFRRAGDVS